MQIYVDADACPVVDIVEKIAKKYQIPVTLLCDTNHVLTSDYSEVVVVGCRTDFADIQNKKECGGNRQWQRQFLRKWAANTKGKAII